MLQEAHDYLTSSKGKALLNTLQECVAPAATATTTATTTTSSVAVEWLIVNDGSSDDTCRVVQSTLDHFLQSSKSSQSSKDNDDCWRLVSLTANSGKGAAVKTGMLLATGHFRLMVDADGATDFGPGLERLVAELKGSMKALSSLSSSSLSNNNNNNNNNTKSNRNRNIAVFGSRAHLEEGSTTQRSLVRTLLMHAFHFFVQLLVSSHIRDTQCGFKLFTREAALGVFPSLHLRRWAFDTEAVLLCDYQQITIVEVGVPWQEVDGSKLNTSKLALAMVSLQMLRDMICVRACYSLGIWNVQR
jgi:dolichyl-phosphate beta-glucosyltransferase